MGSCDTGPETIIKRASSQGAAASKCAKKGLEPPPSRVCLCCYLGIPVAESWSAAANLQTGTKPLLPPSPSPNLPYPIFLPPPRRSLSTDCVASAQHLTPRFVYPCSALRSSIIYAVWSLLLAPLPSQIHSVVILKKTCARSGDGTAQLPSFNALHHPDSIVPLTPTRIQFDQRDRRHTASRSHSDSACATRHEGGPERGGRNISRVNQALRTICASRAPVYEP